jgi:hypothetical protein
LDPQEPDIGQFKSMQSIGTIASGQSNAYCVLSTDVAFQACLGALCSWKNDENAQALGTHYVPTMSARQ